VARKARKRVDRGKPKEGAPPSVNWKDDPWTQAEIDAYNSSSVIGPNHPMFASVTDAELRDEGLLEPHELPPGLRSAYANMNLPQRRFLAFQIKREGPLTGWKDIHTAFRLELHARGVPATAEVAARFLEPHLFDLEEAERQQAERTWALLEDSPLEKMLSTIAKNVVQMGRRSVTTKQNTVERYKAIAHLYKKELEKLSLTSVKQLGWGEVSKLDSRVARTYTQNVRAAGVSSKGISTKTVARARKDRGL
jgi:hypothetical protein